MLQFVPRFAIVDKSSYHAARINVSRNAFLNSRSEEKNISLTFIPGKNKSKCGFVVCTLIDNGYASLLFPKQCFHIASACWASLQKFLTEESWRVPVAHLHNAAHVQVGQSVFSIVNKS